MTVWKTILIQITQYSCDYNNLAPEGCTQYFYGSTTGSVKTYNFDGGQQLADQNQNICVRYDDVVLGVKVYDDVASNKFTAINF